MLNFWTYAARLAGERLTAQIIGMDDVLKALGIDPVPALVGFIWREETENEEGRRDCSVPCRGRARRMPFSPHSEAAWERVRHLVKPENDAEFAAIKAYYRAGIPSPWTGAETQSAEKLTQVLIGVGASELMGGDTRFDPKLFHAAGS